MGRMAMTHIRTRWWYMRGIGGMARTRAAEVNIDTGRVIPFMGGKDEVMGGEGFQDDILMGKEGMMRGRETT